LYEKNKIKRKPGAERKIEEKKEKKKVREKKG